MKLWFAGITLFSISMCGAAVGEDEQPAVAIPKASMSPAVFKYTGEDRKKEDYSKFNWRRPTEVSFVLMTGCGGGGGGGPGSRISGIGGGPMGGAQGGASRVETHLAGPLTASSYQVLIGRGGEGGEAGKMTEIIGTDFHFSFEGGDRGTARDSGPRAAEQGEASPYGPGGIGGLARKQGEDSSSPCAGGGGGGGKRDLADQPLGGRGGDGRLIIYPLPDVQRMLDYMSTIDLRSK